MKKILFTIIVSFLCCCAVAQNPAEHKKQLKDSTKTNIEKPVIIRDRLTFDIFHSFWMGTPKQGNFKKFNPGFNVTAMWDFTLPQQSAISFGLGLGFTYFTQYSNCLLQYDYDDALTKYYVIPDGIKYKNNHIIYTNCNIPFEIRYRHRNGFKFSVGIHVGLVSGLAQRYKGPDYDGTEEVTLNYKDKDFYEKTKFSADVYMRIGWKAIGVYYSYQLNKVFNTGKGPNMNPMSLGISISLF